MPIINKKKHPKPEAPEGVGAMVVFQQENNIYIKEAQDTMPRSKNKVGIQYIDYLSKMNIFEKSGDRRDTLLVYRYSPRQSMSRLPFLDPGL